MVDINIEINKILEENKIQDLHKFIDKREHLNNCNYYMMYLFYFVQSAGILTTTIATSYNKNEFIWVGVGLNFVASLLHSYSEYNNNIISKLYKDINAIKNNAYVDEDLIIDLDDKVHRNTK